MIGRGTFCKTKQVWLLARHEYVRIIKGWRLE